VHGLRRKDDITHVGMEKQTGVLGLELPSCWELHMLPIDQGPGDLRGKGGVLQLGRHVFMLRAKLRLKACLLSDVTAQYCGTTGCNIYNGIKAAC